MMVPPRVVTCLPSPFRPLFSSSFSSLLPPPPPLWSSVRGIFFFRPTFSFFLLFPSSCRNSKPSESYSHTAPLGASLFSFPPAHSHLVSQSPGPSVPQFRSPPVFLCL